MNLPRHATPGLPFKIPYPVPFKLLQDESKGWLDTTYLSPDGTFRLSRGNKGTLFVLTKEEGDNISAETLSVVTDRGLLNLIDTGGDADQVEAAIEKMAEDSAQSSEETLKYLEGEWKLKWTSQGATASGIQKFATSYDNFQVSASLSPNRDFLLPPFPTPMTHHKT